MSETRVAILGCGYTGLRLAKVLAGRGSTVAGTTRTTARFDEIRAAGAEPLELDVLEPSSLEALREWKPDIVFDMIRPQRTGRDQYSVLGSRRLVELLVRLSPEAIVYLSSTSVYGRRDGHWTDETTQPNPTSPLGEARLHTEALYLDAYRTHGLPVRIARVPGIYGPGRTLRERLESGAYRRVDEDALWVSRIHVDDLVQGLVAVGERGRSGEVYLLCDDEPVTGQEYAQLTAELLAVPLPPMVEREDIRGELSRSAFERRIADRRCSNRRMREELGVIPIYPSVREGIPAALREEGAI
jgi:nucleoside-diphosphate-sugar epimerase